MGEGGIADLLVVQLKYPTDLVLSCTEDMVVEYCIHKMLIPVVKQVVLRLLSKLFE